ncbi:MAG: protein translocase subunit SecD [Gammaproteobacteria bacterium]|nr:protein translocase subunit SecD [Gammaproteobacteria bacterium]
MLDFKRQLPKSKVVLNRTPRWLNILMIIILLVAALYAAPNLFGENPAVQISSSTPGEPPSAMAVNEVTAALKKAALPTTAITRENKHIIARFNTADEQLKGKEVLQQALGSQFIVASYNAPATPNWLRKIGGQPMKLGLDLRGGMSLLLQVDVADVIKRRLHNSIRDIGQTLRKEKIPYRAIIPGDNSITINFREATQRDSAFRILAVKLREYSWQKNRRGNQYQMIGQLSQPALIQIRQYTMEQSINSFSRRVNELGISEAQVQQQGMNRISIELPGVADATEAQDILGKTATIDVHLVDIHHDLSQTLVSGKVPPGDLAIKDQSGRSVLLKSDIVLSGDSITNAVSSLDQRSGDPQVSVTVAGGAQSKLYNTTRANVGKPMAVVYNETKSTKQKVNGKMVIRYHKHSTVISVANIQGAFGANFRVTGLSSAEAKQLALLLRAGSLPANVTILTEQQVGPSMGKANVRRGKLSIEIGFLLVVLFMALYYRTMGIIADIALFVNLILIVAIMSLLRGTMTFPGIASLVLTIGMAVDGNVLIFERIREELRRGTSIQGAIHAGYNRAAVTIVDAQLTTLIAAIVLFAIGVGPIKGFAIVLTIGLFTSMLTSITYTRAMVNFLFGGKAMKKLPIGITVKREKR